MVEAVDVFAADAGGGVGEAVGERDTGACGATLLCAGRGGLGTSSPTRSRYQATGCGLVGAGHWEVSG